MTIEPELAGWLGLAAMFVVLAAGVPIAFTLFLVGFCGYWLLGGSQPALATVALIPYTRTAYYTLSVVPLFMLMGFLLGFSKIGSDIFETARYWVGRIPGGLAHATVVGCAIFAAACGSGIAGVAAMTKVAVPEMLNAGYDKKMAAACVAAVGPIAQMIPPSVPMVLYGVITETPITKLLIAGILPGIVACLIFIILILILVTRNPALAPPVSVIKWTPKGAISSIKGVLGILLLVFLVMGGIYSGIFTPTEAGGVGAFGAIIIGSFRGLTLKGISDSITETIKVIAMIFLIICGAMIFGFFLTPTNIAANASAFLTSLPVPPLMILMAVMLLYIVLGTFLDTPAAWFITLPIIFPAIKALGFDPIWFGVLLVQTCELALITPPFGLSLFVMKGMMGDQIQLNELIQGVIPFIWAEIVTLGILIAFPAIALWLPSMMK